MGPKNVLEHKNLPYALQKFMQQ